MTHPGTAAAFPHSPPADTRAPAAPGRSEQSGASPGLAASWIGGGAWAVLDQALFGLSNFGLNVMLARLLSPSDYGAFAAAFSVFLVLSVGHTAVVLQPLLVFGNSTYAARQQGYIRALLHGHWIVAAIGSAMLLVVAGVSSQVAPGTLPATLFVLALACPFVLLQWLMRRICYMQMTPRRAAEAGLLYCAILFCGASGLWRSGLLRPSSVLLLMAAGSLLSALYIRTRLRASGPGRLVRLREVAADHLRFGRWTASTLAVETLGQNVYILALPLVGGLESAGVLKALLNLEMPLLQAFSALSVLLVAPLVQMRASPRFMRVLSTGALLFAAVGLAYWLVLGLNGQRALGWLYGSDYAAHAPVLWIVGLLPVIAGASGVVGAGLHALGRPDVVFRAALLGSSVGLSLAAFLLVLSPVAGAASGLVLSPALMTLLLLRRIRPAAAEAAGSSGRAA